MLLKETHRLYYLINIVVLTVMLIYLFTSLPHSGTTHVKNIVLEFLKPEDESSMTLRNVRHYLPKYITSFLK